MSKILKNSPKETGEIYSQISLNFIIFFCPDVIKFLKSRVESGTIRGQQPELREMRVLIAVVFFRLEFMV